MWTCRKCESELFFNRERASHSFFLEDSATTKCKSSKGKNENKKVYLMSARLDWIFYDMTCEHAPGYINGVRLLFISRSLRLFTIYGFLWPSFWQVASRRTFSDSRSFPQINFFLTFTGWVVCNVLLKPAY